MCHQAMYRPKAGNVRFAHDHRRPVPNGPLPGMQPNVTIVGDWKSSHIGLD